MRNWTGTVTVGRPYNDPEEHRFNVAALSKLRAELAVSEFYKNKYARSVWYDDDAVSLTVNFDDHLDAIGDECV